MALSVFFWLLLVLTAARRTSDISGVVVISDVGGALKVTYDCTNLEPNVKYGALHVHNGVSCTDMGGYYSNAGEPSPFITVHYQTNEHGEAHGYFFVSGLVLEPMAGHVFVIHLVFWDDLILADTSGCSDVGFLGNSTADSAQDCKNRCEEIQRYKGCEVASFLPQNRQCNLFTKAACNGRLKLKNTTAQTYQAAEVTSVCSNLVRNGSVLTAIFVPKKIDVSSIITVTFSQELDAATQLAVRTLLCQFIADALHADSTRCDIIETDILSVPKECQSQGGVSPDCRSYLTTYEGAVADKSLPSIAVWPQQIKQKIQQLSSPSPRGEYDPPTPEGDRNATSMPVPLVVAVETPRFMGDLASAPVMVESSELPVVVRVVVGVVLAVVLVCVLITVVFLVLRRRRKNSVFSSPAANSPTLHRTHTEPSTEPKTPAGNTIIHTGSRPSYSASVSSRASVTSPEEVPLALHMGSRTSVSAAVSPPPLPECRSAASTVVSPPPLPNSRAATLPAASMAPRGSLTSLENLRAASVPVSTAPRGSLTSPEIRFYDTVDERAPLRLPEAPPPRFSSSPIRPVEARVPPELPPRRKSDMFYDSKLSPDCDGRGLVDGGNEPTLVGQMRVFPLAKNTYRSCQILGKGKFGVAYLVTDDKEGKQYVLKTLACGDADTRNTALKEAKALLQTPDNVHLLKQKDYWFDGNDFCMLINYCSGGTLAEQVTSLVGPVEVERMLKELCEGLSALHAVNLVHRDLKPDNVFLLDPISRTVVVGDMGMARQLSERGYYDSAYGHVLYKAPEMAQGKYSRASDMWSVGCIGLELLSGTPLAEAHRESRFILGSCSEARRNTFISAAIGVHSATTAYDIVRKLLVTKPEERLTAEQVVNFKKPPIVFDEYS